MNGLKFDLHSRRFRHFTTAAVVALVFTLGFALGTSSSRTNAQDAGALNLLSPEAEEAFRPVFQIFNMIDEQYVDPVETSVLIDGAAAGMMDALEDAYSGYMNPEVYPMFSNDLSGEFEGIGAVISGDEETGEISILSLIPGSPAAESGLLPGDVFVGVDSVDISEWDTMQFTLRVRGPAGTDVLLTVRRGEEFLDFLVTRAHIVIPNVTTDLLVDGKIAYVQLNSFTNEARSLLDAAFEELDVNSRTGLILDVRGNPGGYLQSAIDVTSAFVRDGTVAIEDFGDGQTTTYTATGDYAGIRVPIVLLINESSASASEILAGALQDLDLATLIGETTLGKGTVQTWSGLANGGGIRLTIARWMTPSGRWIHEQGVTPDIFIDFTPELTETDEDPQLDAAIRLLLGEEVESSATEEPELAPAS